MRKSKAFTLIEVIFVIAIIAILSAILLPGISKLKQCAQKLRDVSHLRKIAEAWRECTVNRGWIINGVVSGDSGKRWVIVFAEQLAGRGRKDISNVVLNSASIYISPGDKYASKIRKEYLCYINNANKIITNSDNCYTRITNFMISNEMLISYCLVMNLPPNIPLDTTPLGFTRGLREDGKWDEKGGLYGSSGGYVVYCDGHVVWFDGSKPAKFLKWDKSGYTSNIREAVPNTTFIACCNGNGNTSYTSDGSVVILFHAGTGGA
ncbi:MAG: prepilin-type N-terminal cleavage/methylation domain-containing protein [Puniceicoccales bacterium]|jgi:prepilin-type N-terminal cleavage/methylation domain-containing protein|nr:prepilin-type N-terminal cleavage/methylation domain-containing protein [Puniceicoccales bacterium]